MSEASNQKVDPITEAFNRSSGFINELERLDLVTKKEAYNKWDNVIIEIETNIETDAPIKDSFFTVVIYDKDETILVNDVADTCLPKAATSSDPKSSGYDPKNPKWNPDKIVEYIKETVARKSNKLSL